MYILKFLQEVGLHQVTTIVLLLGLLGWIVWYFFIQKRSPTVTSTETHLVVWEKRESFWKRFFTETIGDDIEKCSKNELKQIYALNKARFWISIPIGYAILWISIFMILPFFEMSKENTKQISLLSILLHFIVSWLNLIDTSERGFIKIFGKQLFNVGRGPKFVPFGFCKLKRFKRTVFEIDIPTTEAKTFRSERGKADTIPPELQNDGWEHPIRATFAGFSDDKDVDATAKSIVEKFNPFKEILTIEVPGFVIGNIEDPILYNSTIGDMKDLPKARRQMISVYTKSVTTHLPKITLAEFYANRETYDDKIRADIDALTDKWGIKISVANIKEPKQSHELNTAILEMSTKKAKARADEFEGKGLGKKEEEILIGKANGLKFAADKTKLDILDILTSETATNITENVGNLTAVGSEGISDILKIVAAGKSVLQTTGKKGLSNKKEKGAEDK